MRRIDVKGYLNARKEQFVNRPDAVRDYTVFDFGYIPEQPLMREEAKTVIDAILRYDHTGIPENLALVGSRGSGKTLLLRYLARLFENGQGPRVLYCNVRHHDTSFKILAHFLGVQARGSSFDELFSRFQGEFTSPCVVVLDEIDLINSKDKSIEILYRLSRCSTAYMVVMLSNNPRLLQKLDPSARSSLQPIAVHFKNYDANQIAAILRERARVGLNSIDEECIGKIAAMTTRDTNSDVRIAIKSLFYTATDSGLSVESAFERASKDIVVDVIQDLNDKCLLILESARTAKSQLAKDIYTKYKDLSQQVSEIPFSYVHFCSNLSYLQSSGLLLLASTKVGRTYMNRIQVLFDEEIEAETFRQRFN